jgi:hypothetical protein
MQGLSPGGRPGLTTGPPAVPPHTPDTPYCNNVPGPRSEADLLQNAPRRPVGRLQNPHDASEAHPLEAVSYRGATSAAN